MNLKSILLFLMLTSVATAQTVTRTVGYDSITHRSSNWVKFVTSSNEYYGIAHTRFGVYTNASGAIELGTNTMIRSTVPTVVMTGGVEGSAYLLYLDYVGITTWSPDLSLSGSYVTNQRNVYIVSTWGSKTNVSMIGGSGSGAGGTLYVAGNGIDITDYAISVTNYNTNTWNTAFGWGDHSQAGYLTVETDPVFSTNGVVRSDTNGWTVSAHQGWLLEEADPVFITNGLARSATNGWVVSSHDSFLTVEADPVFVMNGMNRSETNGWVVSPHLSWLISESDPVFTNWLGTAVISTVESDPIFTNFLATGSFSTVESDPVFTNWVSTNTYITTATNEAYTVMTNWTHGYLTNEPAFTNWGKTNIYVKTELDPVAMAAGYTPTGAVWTIASNYLPLAGSTVTGSVYSTVDHTVDAPADSELVTAGWVRGLAIGGVEWYFTTNRVREPAAAYAKSTNLVALSATNFVNAFSNSIASPTNGQYLAVGVTTQSYTSLRSPISFEMYMMLTGGNTASTVAVHPEVYYYYEGGATTNLLGDWEAANQTVTRTPTIPTRFKFVVPFTEPTITGSVKIVGVLKAGAIGSLAATLQIVAGGAYSSAMSIESVAGSTGGGTVTNVSINGVLGTVGTDGVCSNTVAAGGGGTPHLAYITGCWPSYLNASQMVFSAGQGYCGTNWFDFTRVYTSTVPVPLATVTVYYAYQKASSLPSRDIYWTTNACTKVSYQWVNSTQQTDRVMYSFLSFVTNQLLNTNSLVAKDGTYLLNRTYSGTLEYYLSLALDPDGTMQEPNIRNTDVLIPINSITVGVFIDDSTPLSGQMHSSAWEVGRISAADTTTFFKTGSGASGGSAWIVLGESRKIRHGTVDAGGNYFTSYILGYTIER
jgi:hypothetical protein